VLEIALGVVNAALDGEGPSIRALDPAAAVCRAGDGLGHILRANSVGGLAVGDGGLDGRLEPARLARVGDCTARGLGRAHVDAVVEALGGDGLVVAAVVVEARLYGELDAIGGPVGRGRSGGDLVAVDSRDSVAGGLCHQKEKREEGTHRFSGRRAVR
jgi:hypothetical protein